MKPQVVKLDVMQTHEPVEVDIAAPIIPKTIPNYSELIERIEAIEAKESSWDGKQDALEFDAVPSNGSTNPVYSSGLFDAFEALDSRMSDYVLNSTFVSELEQLDETYSSAFNTINSALVSIGSDITNLENNKADSSAIPSKVSDLVNDAHYAVIPPVYTNGDSGDVVATLEAGIIYVFNGLPTSLYINLASAFEPGLGYYFCFYTGLSAPTITLPGQIQMPDNWEVRSNRYYEVSIFNDFATVLSWELER